MGDLGGGLATRTVHSVQKRKWSDDENGNCCDSTALSNAIPLSMLG
jgi:hypothetical protein